MMHIGFTSALAAVLSAVPIFMLNRKVQTIVGTRALLLLTPLWEETLKAVLAYTCGAALWLVHLFFGGIEAGADWFSSPRGQWRHVLSSLLAHVLFGLLSVLSAFRVGGQQPSLLILLQPLGNTTQLLWAWLVAVGAHMLWNCGVLFGMRRHSSGGSYS